MAEKEKPRKIALIAFKCSAGATTRGAHLGPEFLKRAELQDRLAALDGINEVIWFNAAECTQDDIDKNVENLSDEKRRDIVLEYLHDLKDMIVKAIDQGYFPYTVGGDHSSTVAMGWALAEFYNAYKDIGVLQFDAHPDLQRRKTSDSQSLHGMTNAAMSGMGMEAFELPQRILKPGAARIVGVRDRAIDDAERGHADELDAPFVTMKELNKRGMARALLEEWNAVKAAGKRFLTLDTDFFNKFSVLKEGGDPFEITTGTPVENGGSLEEIIPFLEDIDIFAEAHGFDCAEFAPNLSGDPDKTAELLIRASEALFSKPRPEF